VLLCLNLTIPFILCFSLAEMDNDSGVSASKKVRTVAFKL